MASRDELNKCGFVAAFEQGKQVWSNGDDDLSQLNGDFTKINELSAGILLGELSELVTFGSQYEVARPLDGRVICSKSSKLDQAFLAQDIFKTCTGRSA